MCQLRESIRINLAIFSLITLLICSYFPNNAQATYSDYDELKIEENEWYEWEITKMDEDSYEDMSGEGYSVVYEEGNTFKIEIERIIEQFDDKIDDHWLIEYEEFGWEKEEDDQGDDWDSELYRNPENHGSEIDGFVNDECEIYDFGGVDFLFIPSDNVEDFLNESADHSSDLESNNQKIVGTFTDGNATIEYNDNGILEKITATYNNETIYVIELSDSGVTRTVPFGHLYLGFMGAGIIGLVVLVKRKLKA